MIKPKITRVIVILMDGLGADYVAAHGERLPALKRLAASGLAVPRMTPPTCATSLPGRASILTGAPSADSGTYGNMIYDNGQFRFATPADLRVPTLAGRASAEGLEVACLGFVMTPPGECRRYAPA
jgi:predicted AlkP superfamily pyrophosphatase or phosphodiesterase